MPIKPEIICGDNILDAWLKASRRLFDSKDLFNLNVFIKSSELLPATEINQYNPKSINPKIMSVMDVANTIFPKPSEKWDMPVKDFCEYYEPIYKKLLRATPSSWGMYFLRLINFGDSEVNQLETIVGRLKKWGKKHRAAFYCHFSSMEMDKPRPRGAPCLQYCQIGKSDNNSLSMSFVYRSHDFYEKTLGNFVGLSRLLNYICHHVESTPGSMHCLSTYAHYQGAKSKKNFGALLKI